MRNVFFLFTPTSTTARNESQRLASTITSDSTLMNGNTWNKSGKLAAGKDLKDSNLNSTYELHTMDKISGINEY